MNQALLENKIAMTIQDMNPTWTWFMCQQQARKQYAFFKESLQGVS